MNDVMRALLFLPRQGSTVAYDVDRLHYFVILVTMFGAAFVTLIGGYYIIRYRKISPPTAAGGEAEQGPEPILRRRPYKRAPLWTEAGAVVGLIVLFVGWWFIGASEYIRLRVAPEDAMIVYVTSKQWMWKFAHTQGVNSIATLYVPVRRPVKLIMTSRDVIHSFYVPDFRIKQDVIPGRYTTVWFEATAPGTYPILCAEYCGTGHSTMRGEVVALEPNDFERWLAGEPMRRDVSGPVYSPPAIVGQFAPPEPVGLEREGERAAAQHGCLRCHTTDGTPHIGPTWASLYGSTVRLVRGQTAVADEAYITESMMDPLAKRVDGFNPVMPSYVGLIDPAETAAIVEFIKSLKDVPIAADAPPAMSALPPPLPATAPEGGRR